VLWYAVSRPFTGYATLAAFANSRYQSVAPFFYLSRGLSAVAGTATVWFVFALCRRVFDETVAIVAALFTALAYLHVRDSHFGMTDVTMTALVVLTVAAVVRWQDTGDWRDAALAGIAGGLATSTKYNALGVWVPFAIAVGLRATGAPSCWRIGLRQDARAVGAFAVAFVLAFFATSPYVLIEWRRFLHDVVLPGQMLVSNFAGGSSRGWWHYAAVTLPAALGWPMYVVGVSGLLLMLMTRFRRTAAVLAFPIAYYAVAGYGYTVFARYIIPVLPFLCIGAAWLVVAAVRAIVPTRLLAARSGAIAIVACALVWPSARNVVLLDRLFTRTDNRLLAARTLVGIIPPGSLVYHSGGMYGHIAFDVQGVELTVNECEYDEATGRFTPSGTLPDWIILQRSPLAAYSYVPAGVERLVGQQYDLVRTFIAAAPDPRATYDQQDAFFLPLTGLDRVKRPGPDFEVYRLRNRGSASRP
jgi:hypothetical protein